MSVNGFLKTKLKLNQVPAGLHKWIFSLSASCLLLVAAAMLQAMPVHAQATSQSQATPTSQPSTTQPATTSQPAIVDAAGEDASELQAVGFKDALAGNFGQGLAELKKSEKLSPPDDVAVASAVRLLGDYMAVSDKSKAQRLAEYNAAVQQVQRCMFAQDYMPTLAKAGLDLKIRQKLMGYTKSKSPYSLSDEATDEEGDDEPSLQADSQPATQPAESQPVKANDLVTAYKRVTMSEALSSAVDGESTLEMKKKSIEALQETLVQLDEAQAIIKDDSGEYAKCFDALAGDLRKQLTAYLAQWQTIDVEDATGRADGARELRKIEDDLIEALVNLESIVVEKPWFSALTQARLALMLRPDGDRLKAMAEPWYRNLVDEVEKLGEGYMEKSDWYEAMAVYGNLQELEPNNEVYKELAKTTQRHVRVLRLYGAKPTSQPATSPDDEESISWREMVAGVDVQMVRDAMRQLENSYVEAVDYRKLAGGALRAIKILAQTPQASNAFAGLADKPKHDEFVAAIDSIIEGLPGRNADDMELALILNSVIRSSERTVGIPSDVISMEFMDGLLEELDKFSNMIWPQEVSDFEKQTMGQFFGVGIQIGKSPGEPLKVIAPLEDSPAYKAGIKSGDLILTVDGIRTEGQRVENLVKKITGPEGTKVVLRIKSPGQGPRDIELVREEIHIRTIKGWQRLPSGDWNYMIDGDNKIGYIRLTQFTDQTAPELNSTLQYLREQGCRSLILDMRFNPGGLLRSAGAVSDEFLRDGRIVSTAGRQSGKTEINATLKGNYQGGDLVVLINQQSASAAEIVAGALKDHSRAVIVGQRSYGKGSVQNVIQISKGKAILKATTAYYYLPSGRCLHRKNGDLIWGVDPDVEVMMTPRQTNRWLDIRRKTDLLQDVDPQQLKQDMAAEYKADIQLDTAVLLLRLMQLNENGQPDVAGSKTANNNDSTVLGS
jgi:carboxyl-terminal processing protease